MRIIATPIPPGSHELAIWPELDAGDADTGEPIDTVCNLHQLNQYECVATKAHGRLSDAINIAIGLKAIDLGYNVLHMQVAEGTTVSHWAKYEKTVNGMDFYKVDLVAAVKTLEGLHV